MKKLYLLVLLVSFEQISLATSQAPAVTPAGMFVTVNGQTDLKNKQYHALQINGAATLLDVNVKTDLNINGSATAQRVTCKTLHVNGSYEGGILQTESLQCNGTFVGSLVTVTANAFFLGGVQIRKGTLHNVTVASTIPLFIATNILGSITIKKVLPETTIQILELKDRTVVSGDVIFEQAGEVHFYNGSQIKGKVVNGTIIQK